jgi:hypothetical protein
MAVFFVGYLIATELAGLLFDKMDSRDIEFSTFFIIVLASAGVTIKLSSIVMGFLASLISVGILSYGRADIPPRRIIRCITICSIVAMITLTVWMSRNVVLSGYPVPPGTAFPFNVEWRVPGALMESLAQSIKAWARWPGIDPELVLDNYRWIGPWINTLKKEYHMVNIGFVNTIFPVSVGLLGMLLLTIQSLRGRYLRRAGRILLFLAPPIGSLLFWFFTAPDPRFAGYAFWWFGFGYIAVAVSRLQSFSPRMILVGLILNAVILGYLELPNRPFIRLKSHVSRELPQVRTIQNELSKGLTVNVPVSTDQCWDAELPCSPQIRKRLQLRVPGDLGKGFRINGG